MPGVRIFAIVLASLAATPSVVNANQPTIVTVGTTHALADAGIVIAQKRGSVKTYRCRTSDSVYPRVLNQLVGTKFRIIDGYKSTPN